MTTSILVILFGQANAWYANQPETNIVKDIKRKISIAILLITMARNGRKMAIIRAVNPGTLLLKCQI